METMQWIVSLCLGFGLAACSGFRVFVPMLAANLAYLTGVLSPSAGFEWLATWPAFAVLLTATVAEIAAYYIPYFDHLLDTVNTPVAFVAGSVLMTSMIPADNPALKWALGIIVGGGSAGLVQAGTSLLRLGSTATTGGLGNPIVATVENGLATVLSFLSIFLPILVAVLMVGIIYFMVSKLGKLRRRRQALGGSSLNDRAA